MKLKIKRLNLVAGKPVCMIHEKTAKNMSLHVSERALIKTSSNRKIISIVDTVSGIINPEEIALSEEIIEILNVKDKEVVEVKLAERPYSIELIKKKLQGHTLNKQEIFEIIRNIANNSLTEVEVAFFISAVFVNKMSLEETKNLINAMVSTGNHLKLNGKVADKHCCGGIAGNRTSPIVVSICASAGLIMPKTSSRAITSASGTADTIETLAKVDFSIEKIKQIIKKTNACLVWGGALGLAPVDDKIIKIEKIANIDSSAQLLASILSKKISVGSKYILIDIPFGKSAKVNKKEALGLKEKFLKLAEKFKLKLEVVLTNGSEPIGNGIGPALEIKDVLKVLKREYPPKDLEEKSLLLSGKILELTGKAKKGKGIDLARKILYSGRAFEKFKQIINAQGGAIKNLPEPKYKHRITANQNMKIIHLDNKYLNQLSRLLGCPEDRLAGVYLNKKKNNTVAKAEDFMTLYSESKEKMEYAIKFFNKNKSRIIEFTKPQPI